MDTNLTAKLANLKKSQLVTAFQATPSDEKIPSEKLVKDSIDGISSIVEATSATLPALSDADAGVFYGIDKLCFDKDDAALAAMDLTGTWVSGGLQLQQGTATPVVLTWGDLAKMIFAEDALSNYFGSGMLKYDKNGYACWYCQLQYSTGGEPVPSIIQCCKSSEYDENQPKFLIRKKSVYSLATFANVDVWYCADNKTAEKGGEAGLENAVEQVDTLPTSGIKTNVLYYAKDTGFISYHTGSKWIRTGLKLDADGKVDEVIVLKSRAGADIKKSVDTDNILILGGSDVDKGGSISVVGKDFASDDDKGTVSLIALDKADSSKTHILRVGNSGRATFDEKNIQAYYTPQETDARTREQIVNSMKSVCNAHWKYRMRLMASEGLGAADLVGVADVKINFISVDADTFTYTFDFAPDDLQGVVFRCTRKSTETNWSAWTAVGGSYYSATEPSADFKKDGFVWIDSVNLLQKRYSATKADWETIGAASGGGSAIVEKEEQIDLATAKADCFYSFPMLRFDKDDAGLAESGYSGEWTDDGLNVKNGSGAVIMALTWADLAKAMFAENAMATLIQFKFIKYDANGYACWYVKDVSGDDIAPTFVTCAKYTSEVYPVANILVRKENTGAVSNAIWICASNKLPNGSAGAAVVQVEDLPTSDIKSDVIYYNKSWENLAYHNGSKWLSTFNTDITGAALTVGDIFTQCYTQRKLTYWQGIVPMAAGAHPFGSDVMFCLCKFHASEYTNASGNPDCMAVIELIPATQTPVTSQPYYSIRESDGSGWAQWVAESWAFSESAPAINLKDGTMWIDSQNKLLKRYNGASDDWDTICDPNAKILCSTDSSESPNSFASFVTAYSSRVNIIYGKIVKQGDIYSMQIRFKFTTTKPTWAANTEWLNIFSQKTAMTLITKNGWQGVLLDPANGNYGGMVCCNASSSTASFWPWKAIQVSSVADVEFMCIATWCGK